MEPIPLRTLTTLLNYERMISDPRFHGHKLWRSSLKDGGLVDRTKVSVASILENLPASQVTLLINRHFIQKEPLNFNFLGKSAPIYS